MPYKDPTAQREAQRRYNAKRKASLTSQQREASRLRQERARNADPEATRERWNQDRRMRQLLEHAIAVVTPKAAPAIDTEWHNAFLDVLTQTGNLSAACEAVGVTRQTAYTHRTKFPALQLAWDGTLQDRKPQRGAKSRTAVPTATTGRRNASVDDIQRLTETSALQSPRFFQYEGNGYTVEMLRHEDMTADQFERVFYHSDGMLRARTTIEQLAYIRERAQIDGRSAKAYVVTKGRVFFTRAQVQDAAGLRAILKQLEK